ncbi:cupin domain-containing protein [Halobacillus sp. A5]|uniref:cupin domain-containing protein n=1 Tax=Halobacillus sp. A5 TaxID=2880263 RepID=UPI0020A62A64|nr:cupin domain-containing protein [Halobacillus sp. A5]MCP3027204.1 cupin domain-containing protein [Halobacillus sp. A5]
MKAEDYIKKLELEPHPEGGFYRPSYRSEISESFQQGSRPLYTSIYFLLRSADVSHLHRLQSDELWYFHAGSPLTIHMITACGDYEEVTLGLRVDRGEVPQFVVPKNTIFGSSVKQENTFALAGCMVSPGFDFADFELFSQEELLEGYPEHEDIILKLAYENKGQ